MTSQGEDTTKVQIGEPTSFIGLLIEIWLKGYLQEQELLKKQLHYQRLPQYG